MTSSEPNYQLLKRQTLEAYDWLATTYAEKWFSQLDHQIADRFLDWVPPKAKVLDVGCGPGQYARYFAEHGLDVYAIDYSMAMLKEACCRWSCDRLAKVDMWHLAFPSAIFDALWVCASFNHVPVSQALIVLAELRRVLKPAEGRLFIGTIIGQRAVRVESKDEMGEGYGRSGRFFQRYRSRENFQGYLEQVGFGVVDVIERVIESNVLEHALCRVSRWINFYCIKL